MEKNIICKTQAKESLNNKLLLLNIKSKHKPTENHYKYYITCTHITKKLSPIYCILYISIKVNQLFLKCKDSVLNTV